MRRLIVLISVWMLTACATNPVAPIPNAQNSFLYIYRFEPPALLEYSADFQLLREIPFAVPPNCGLVSLTPAPVGSMLAAELNCPNGQTVLYIDLDAATVSQPVAETDSHFLAWTADGQAAYLKIDSLGAPRVMQVTRTGEATELSIAEFTYDLAAAPNGRDFTFTLSRGMGAGSELWLASGNGKNAQELYSDSQNYISFARWSPDGQQIAFLKIPDSATPFTVGELWVMNADGSDPHLLAEADTGHGYAANWSPDSQWLAFVRRDNPQDSQADQSAAALQSNIVLVNVETGATRPLTDLTEGYAETARWSPDGNMLAFTVVINGRMQVSLAEIRTGEIRTLVTESTCCPAWIRK